MATDSTHGSFGGAVESGRACGRTGQCRSLPIWGWLLLAGYVASVAYIRNIDGLDGAIANILTLVCTFLTSLALFIWFCFYSGYSRTSRRAVLYGVPAVIVTLFALFRIDGVKGFLIPELSFRWTPRPDQLLARAVPVAHGSALPQAPNGAGQQAAANVAPDDKTAGPSAGPGGGLAAVVDLATTTPNDFPQFLGPQRSCWIPGPDPGLDPDWAHRPPKLVWRQPIGAGWAAFSVVNGWAVTLEQRGEEELTTCYEVATGRLMWSHAEQTRHSTVLGGVGPRSTPTLHQGRVYSLGATGILNCLDGATGAVLWTHRLLDEYRLTPELDMTSVAWGRAASPLLVDGLVVVPAGGPPEGPKVSLVAFDQNSGAKAWEGGDDQIAFASPTIATLSGVRQILSVNEATVTGHDPETGKALWSFPWPGSSNQNASNSQPVVIGPDQLFISKGYTGGSALWKIDCDNSGRWTTEQVWADAKIMKTKFTNIVLRDGFVYGLSDGTLECIDVATGKRRWKHGRYNHGQVLGVGDFLIVQAESGEVLLVAIDPKEHRELGRLAAIEGKTWNNPALAGPYLLVRNGEQAACFELPLRAPTAMREVRSE